MLHTDMLTSELVAEDAADGNKDGGYAYPHYNQRVLIWIKEDIEEWVMQWLRHWQNSIVLRYVIEPPYLIPEWPSNPVGIDLGCMAYPREGQSLYHRWPFLDSQSVSI